MSWKSKKQHTFLRSFAEVKCRFMTTVICKLRWLKNILNDLSVTHTQASLLFCDSESTIHIASNTVFHKRTKHIKIDCHLMRDKLQAGGVKILYVASHDQVADLLTKSLGGARYQLWLSKMGVLNIQTPS